MFKFMRDCVNIQFRQHLTSKVQTLTKIFVQIHFFNNSCKLNLMASTNI